MRWPPAEEKPNSAGAGPRRFGNSIGSSGVSDADSSLPPSGQSLSQAFRSLVAILDAHGVRYAIIGGIATIQHTRVRTTDDIDALLAVTQIAAPGLFQALEASGFQVDPPRNIRELLDDGLTSIRFGDVLVDLMRPILPVYAHVLDGARRIEMLGQAVRISSAEGLIVMKLIAFRPQDEADIKDLLAANRGDLDLNHIRAEFATVADPDDPRWAKLESWIGAAPGEKA